MPRTGHGRVARARSDSGLGGSVGDVVGAWGSWAANAGGGGAIPTGHLSGRDAPDDDTGAASPGLSSQPPQSSPPPLPIPLDGGEPIDTTVQPGVESSPRLPEGIQADGEGAWVSAAPTPASTLLTRADVGLGPDPEPPLGDASDMPTEATRADNPPVILIAAN